MNIRQINLVAPEISCKIFYAMRLMDVSEIIDFANVQLPYKLFKGFRSTASLTCSLLT